VPSSLAAPVHSDLTIRKSRFIGCVQPVGGREDALRIVQRLRHEHPGAAHVCWALMAGGQSAANDDGEPGGTAGRPMLEVLRHQDLEGVLATVVRYFGGVKLGAGGLVRAYTDAVAQALLRAEKIPLRRLAHCEAQLPYPLEGWLRRQLDQLGAQLEDTSHAALVRMQFSLPEDRLPDLEAAIDTHGQGRIALRRTDDA